MKFHMQGKAQIILITILATVIIIAGGVFAAMKYGSDFSSYFQESETLEKAKPLYYPMEKLVISVESEKVIYYMMVEISIETKNEQSLSEVRHFLPVIRNHFVKNLSQRNFTSMRSYLKDIEKLQQELLESLLVVLENYDIPKAVDNVLITKLVIQ